jgi:hypothetical protein
LRRKISKTGKRRPVNKTIQRADAEGYCHISQKLKKNSGISFNCVNKKIPGMSFSLVKKHGLHKLFGEGFTLY